ncbi:peptidase [Streptomyces sp. NPDC090022]|uniref:peptidase n=1 Tax=Streptomyces sp. NPDC090022 TaxID=3365920 RepID=UPI0037F19678
MDKRISLLAATGLTALSVGLTAPAHAADRVFPLSGPANAVLQPHPETGAPKEKSLRYDLNYLGVGNSFAGDFTITFDLGKVAGVASVRLDPAKPNPKCAPSGTTIVCKQQELSVGNGAEGGFDLLVSAAQGSKNGASGDIAVTGKVAGATITPVTTKVTVGGPDLVVDELKLTSEAKAGDRQALPLAFANRGTLPAKSIALELDTSYGLELAEVYDNCRREERGVPVGTRTVCLVEGEFLPGESYQLSPESPLHLKVTEKAYNDRLRYGVVPDPVPVKDQDKMPGTTPVEQPATGKKLMAVKAQAPVQAKSAGEDRRFFGAAEQTDLNPVDNERTFDFTAKANKADFEAIAFSQSGKAGDTIAAELGFRNKGPAWISHLRSGESVARTDIVVPDGIKITEVPVNCRAVNADGSDRKEQPGAPRYFCDAGLVASANGKHDLRFVMKIEKAVANAKGSVTVGEPTATGTKPHVFDPVTVNNTTPFVVEVKDGASPSPSASASASASPSPSASASASASASPVVSSGPSAAGGAGGNLASTGSSVGPVALGAAAAVIVGGALYVGVRRRSAGRA